MLKLTYMIKCFAGSNFILGGPSCFSFRHNLFPMGTIGNFGTNGSFHFVLKAVGRCSSLYENQYKFQLHEQQVRH